MLFRYSFPYQDPAHVFSAIVDIPYAVLLDSAGGPEALSRYSIIAAFPAERIEMRGTFCEISDEDGGLTRQEGDPFDIVNDRLGHWQISLHAYAAPGAPYFTGGALGFFGYELARLIEALPERRRGREQMPDMAVGIYRGALVFDHARRTAAFHVHADNAKEAAARHEQMIQALKAPVRPHNAEELEWTFAESRESYTAKIARVIEYVKAGDIFQANLAQSFTAQKPEGWSDYAHYLSVRENMQAPFGSYAHFGGLTLSSFSPEQFLRLDGRVVTTRPIKGTRPRLGLSETGDRVMQASLIGSEKDRAENAMIVDLLRNDLSKVCTDQSIDVPSLYHLETHSHVHHLISVITGRLRADLSPLDLLKACFPGGSVTGAPKIRAMEIIDALEETPRGPYCGSIAYIGFDGTMDSSILIRTLVADDRHVRLQTGGGITALSEPGGEYEETLHKAAGLAALGRDIPATTQDEKRKRIAS